MATFKNVDEAREYFKGDRYAAISGAYLEELTERYSVCSLKITDDHKNANGGIMGGVMFTLADFAFATIANNVHMPTVAQQVSVNYLNPPKGNKLTAKAQIKKSGRTSMVINVDVKDEFDRDVVQFVGTGFKL